MLRTIRQAFNKRQPFWVATGIGIALFSAIARVLHADELFRFHSDTPMRQFITPFFDENGVKTWQCEGETVQYLNESRFNVRKLCITFFDPQQRDKVDMTVRSEDAVVSLPKHRASGKSLLTVTNPEYTIVGEQWVWEGKHEKASFSKVFIGKNANVLFYDR